MQESPYLDLFNTKNTHKPFKNVLPKTTFCARSESSRLTTTFLRNIHPWNISFLVEKKGTNTNIYRILKLKLNYTIERNQTPTLLIRTSCFHKHLRQWYLKGPGAAEK